jgi:cytochrome P450
VVADTSIAGTPVRAGATVGLLVGAANRDSAHFEDPDRFDVTRNPRDHVGFGNGVHLCLGAPLARLEGRIALEALMDAGVHDFGLNGDPERTTDSMLRGVKRLPVSFSVG